ncbi:hypothetical protein [Spiroplasma endosymbiont of Poecilobothrus nobilitatus]|uniref:hypothetical protein n=1 Tax=Spiroplasma endosymbiont of Poecilobothrus nobilitatus TaxID=1209220 RepID=UPI00313E62F3
MGKSLYITNQSGIIKYVTTWPKDNGAYFKAVYRWNDNGENQIHHLFHLKQDKLQIEI